MELFVYGKTHTLLGVAASFEYLRWTRKYSVCGGFEMLAIADKNNLALLQMGHILWKNDDQEAGIIEHIELVMEEQESILVRGRFATGILARRIVWAMENLHGDVSACVSQLVTGHLLNPSNPSRRIAGYAFTSPTFGVPINTQTSYRNLLDAVENLCAANDIGIKTVWNPSTRQFTITLYRGTTSLAVFSQEYENLTGQSYIQSLLGYANTGLVGGEGEGAARQFVAVGGGTGLDRYEMFIDAKDLREEDFSHDYPDALVQRGQSKLAEHPAVQCFDAAVNPHGNLVYKTDFDIGQTIKVVSKAWDVTLTTRITEIEETYDKDGLSLQIVFGQGLLTLAQKLKAGDF